MSSSLISEPAQKDRSPAPVRMTQRIESLSLHSSTAATIASAISGVTAFSFCGRLSVMVAMAPSTLNRMSCVMVILPFAALAAAMICIKCLESVDHAPGRRILEE